MKTLPIIWKRLVSAEGKTCERCGATRSEMQRAVAKLIDVTDDDRRPSVLS
jgi:hypothetical protein